MVEMMDIQVMTDKATDKSLVIIDELGRGTSTGEGMAIAQAVIEHLHDQIGCKTLVSTHFHELAHLEDTLQSLRNYCMAVKESGRQVTFLRKLVPGAASTSYGIYCAQIAGLPGGIIDRSYELLHAFEQRSELLQDPLAKPMNEYRSTETHSSAATATIAQIQPPQQQIKETAAVQLSLFQEEAAAASRTKKKSDPKLEQLVDQLKTADLMNMTPMMAMNFLFDLKKQLT
jgi:DNA mismatch repair protein MutS